MSIKRRELGVQFEDDVDNSIFGMSLKLAREGVGGGI